MIQIRLQDETARAPVGRVHGRPIDKGRSSGVLEMLFEADGNLAAQVDAYLGSTASSPPSRPRLREARSGADEGVIAPDRSNIPVPDGTEQREDINLEREGTYLYGNWDAATPQVGGGVGHGEGEPTVSEDAAYDRPPPQTIRTNVMSQTFEELYSLIETHPDLDEDAKRDLQAELQEIQRLLIRTHRRAREAGRD